MSRLSRVLIGGDQPDREEIVPRLQRFYIAMVQRSRQLSAHAGLAPNEASRLDLARLSEEKKDLVERFRKVLRQLDTFAGDVAGATETPGALNHWSRLVQDLEAHREAVKGLGEAAMHLSGEGLEELSAAVAELAHGEERHALALRQLIARADPHAID